MNLEQFMARVLPTTGVYFIGMLHNNKYHQTSSKTRKDLIDSIRKVVTNNLDVYYATSTFKSGKREAVNVKEKKCFYIDIDCGEGKGYDTKRDGAIALHNFRKTVGLPKPSILVDSGGGLHAYWTLDKCINLDTWVTVASALKIACAKHGFDADPVCTADAARILRVPESNNYRHGHAIPCRIISSIDKDYSLMDIATPLVSYAKQIVDDGIENLPVPPTTVAGITNDLSSGIDISKVYKFKPMVKQCSVLRNILIEGGESCSEPLWMQVLNLLAFVDDGEKYIHAIGNKHKGYTPDTTVAKFRLRQQGKARGTTGPTLCSTFEASRSTTCKACPHYEKIKTPIVLGVPEVKRKMPHGYSMNKHGIYKTYDDEIIKILPYQIYDFEAYYDPDGDGIVLCFNYQLSNAHGSAIVPYKLLGDGRGLATVLAIAGIGLHKKQQLEFAQLMTTWYQQMQSAKEVKNLNQHMGWEKHNKKVGFVTGTMKFWEDGTETHAPLLDRQLKQQFTPQGAFEPWHKAAQFVLDQGNPDAAAAIASSFAAPLMIYSGVSGATFSVISKKSGTGKTTCLKIAQGVWGDPRLAINIHGDTNNAFIHRMGKIRHLPAYWDELIKDDDVKEFVTLMFNITGGKEKSRMTSDIQLRTTGTWSTLLTVASNQTILDHIEQLIKNTDAGKKRVMEITMEDKIASRDLSVANAMFIPLNENFGHAGMIYAKYITTHIDEIKEDINKTVAVLTNTLVVTTDERFWVAIITCLIVGAKTANKAGILQFDIDALNKFLIVAFKKMRGNVKEEFESDTNAAIGHLFTYLGQREAYTVFIERLAAKKKAQGTILIMAQRSPAYVVLSRDDNIVRINLKDLRDWLYKNTQSPSWIIAELERTGGRIKRGVLCQGLPGVVAGRISVIDIPLTEGAMGKMIGGLDTQTGDQL